MSRKFGSRCTWDGCLDIVVSNAGRTKVVSYEDLASLDDEIWLNRIKQKKTNKKKKVLWRQRQEPLLFHSEERRKVFTKISMGVIFNVLPLPTEGIPVKHSYAINRAALIHLVEMLAKSNDPK
ncbi:hypothetical protein JCM33374_g4875 [Metschnikowia sp. JCM 33374]|nr:hypothetical protein JCM33374_g4875 [Metschnikowia sp. JCM 33374]